jgi:glycosyltransferase involved in cell wall biosynthesis
LRSDWPALSVVVCAYNEERYLGDCLESLLHLDYPNLDVVICDDGSTDRTLEIASRYPFRIQALEHKGLSAARNAGLEVARGDLIAYLDADAACDPDWPYHLALSFESGVDATGGPNLPVPSAGFAERVVAYSPGGPMQVLITDDRAEHVVGANMAFRRCATWVASTSRIPARATTSTSAGGFWMRATRSASPTLRRCGTTVVTA